MKGRVNRSPKIPKRRSQTTQKGPEEKNTKGIIFVEVRIGRKKDKDAERKLKLMGSRARPISFPKKAE